MTDAPVAVSKPKRGRPSKAEIAARESQRSDSQDAVAQVDPCGPGDAQPNEEVRGQAGTSVAYGEADQTPKGQPALGVARSLTAEQHHALDHDNDGKAGGSLPHKLPPREVEALKREAEEAYQMQDERKRDDSLRRKWTFRPASRNDHASLMLHCQRGVDERSEFILNDRLGIEAREQAIRKAVENLIEQV